MPLRRKIMKAFQKALPPLSQTEQEALESGSVGFEAELLGGNPDWKKLFELKKPELTAEEQAFLDGPTEELCKMLKTWEVEKRGDLSPEVWDFIKKEGFMGLEIPKEYGGKGFSSQAHSAIVMKISSRNVVGAVTIMVPNSLGPAKLIHAYGTKDQKDYYLPRLAKGEEIPCFALTGPEAGSDATSIPDRGIVCMNEKGELGVRVNWEKRYITLGPVASLIGLAFQMEDPDGLLGDAKDIGITVALVKRDTPGVEIGDRHHPLDVPFQNGPNKGKDVFIPLSDIIGGQERAGQGWKMLVESLSVGRALSLPAQSVAAAKLMTYATGAYSRVRRQFGTAIGRFEGIEEVLARMGGMTYMMNAARLATLQMVDQGGKPGVPSAMLKYHLTEGMRKIVTDAMDVHGGKAISNGPNNIFVGVYKSIPIAITVEGANIMTRNLIVFGQGSVRSHPYILKEMEAANDKNPEAGFKKLSGLLARHVAHGIKSAAKSMIYGLSGRGGNTPVKDKNTKGYYKEINRLSAAFNLASDATLATLGGGLKIKERTSARLGDVFSHLYMASCVLWHYEVQGRPKEDLPLVEWALKYNLSKAEDALEQAVRNHPASTVRKMLPAVLFPSGKKHRMPDDRLDKKVAEMMREPGVALNKIASGIFLPTAEGEYLATLKQAFLLSAETEPLEKKMALAVKKELVTDVKSRDALLTQCRKSGIITEEEYQLLRRADAVRRAVIDVDSFPQKEPLAKGLRHQAGI